MKILLFGKSGQVGWELQRSLAPLGELIALDHGSPYDANGGLCGDFTDLDGIARTVRSVAPDVCWERVSAATVIPSGWRTMVLLSLTCLGTA